MEFVKGMMYTVKQIYNDINPATLTGAIDVIVVERPNGQLVSTPFHVRFGKINVMNFVGKTVDIYINNQLTNLRMKLGANGEAFFVEDSEEEPPEHLATSPLPTSPLTSLSPNDIHNLSPRKRSGSSPAVVSMRQADGRMRVVEDTGEDLALAETKSLSFKSEEDPKLKVNITGSLPVSTGEKSLKSKKRRKKSKMMIENAKTEESSSSDQDVQFPMDGVYEDGPAGRASPAQPPNSSSDAMKTAKTQNNNMKIELTGETNTSNTTVTSDDEFNWASVASGVAPARLASGCHQVVSDGDLSDQGDRLDRPPSPAKSDTEIELRHNLDEDLDVKWSWGELPSGQMQTLEVKQSPEVVKRPEGSPPKSEEAKTKGDIGTSGGLYLDEVLAEKDPGMRERYIGSRPRKVPAHEARHRHHHEDGESGNGPSLSQSPQSGLDSDYEPDCRHPVFDYCSKKYSDLSMSLCGYIEKTQDVHPSQVDERFLAHLVTYDDFCMNPDIINEPNLVFRMNGKYYNWKAISPQLLSLAMFQTPLSGSIMEKLCAEHMPKKKTVSPPQQVKTSSRWWWSRGGQEENKGDETDGGSGSQKEALLLQPTPQQQKAATLEVEQLLEDADQVAKHSKKSLRLSTEQLAALGLKPGRNYAEFKVVTAFQGTSCCSCHIYMWKSTDKIVISDIDGTITKSDVLGHILPIIGKDWAQSGVASLFNQIGNNGYRLIYLSARAIGQAHMTRGFLRSIKQDNLWLPDGPVLLNPTSLLSALHREVVAKNPHLFKISCLKDVKQLFNYSDGSVGLPFYAGFGNKTTDALAYKAVSVPVNRIFTINHRGDISQELMGNVGKTYKCLGDIADLIFPPVRRQDIPGEYSSFSYWKDPLPIVEIEDLTKDEVRSTVEQTKEATRASSPLKSKR